MIKITVDTKDTEKQFKELSKEIAKLPQKAHRVFVKNTPKRTGNARNKTKVSGTTIRANYDYASRLDSGSSKQSPKGMTAPTLKFIKTKLEEITRNL